MIPPVRHSREIKIIMKMIPLLILLLLTGGCTIPDDNSSSGLSTDPDISQNILITDSAGKNYSYQQPVQRIVVLNAAAAEMLISIGAGDKIVGVADFVVAIQTHPYLISHLSNATRVGDFMTPDVETIISLHPDVVITYANSRHRNLDKMLAANISVLHFTSYRPVEVASDARTLGRLTGHNEGAERYARFVEKNLALIDKRVRNFSEEEKTRIYFEGSDYNACGPGSSGGEIISPLPVKNVAENITSDKVRVNAEWILEQDPDVIIKSVQGGCKNFSSIKKDMSDRPGFSSLKAVRNNKVYCLSPVLVSTPRSVVGSLYVAKALYPDLFSDIDPQTILHEYAQEFLIGSDESDVFCPLDSSNQSPFKKPW